MVTKCSVPKCRNKGRRFSEQHFHRFPRDVEICRLWLVAMKHRLAAGVFSRDNVKHLRVCSDHFLPEDYRKLSLCNALKPSAVPSVFPPNASQSPETEAQGFHLKAGLRPGLPTQSEVVPFPQPPHKGSFSNQIDSASLGNGLRVNRQEICQKRSFVKDENPSPLSQCSEVEDKSWHRAVKSFQTDQETNVKSREVMVNTQCLLELFQFCWLCHKECRITTDGSEKLFSVTQDCQSCGYHRDWRSHPSSAEHVEGADAEEQHVTIQNGGLIQLSKCMQCCTKYHCPFCRPDVFKPTVESKVRKHIKAHEKRAVRFKEFVIFKCGLNCRLTSHFHCPKCCKLLDKRNRFMDHLNKCMGGVRGGDEGQNLPVEQEANIQNMSVEEENNQVPKEKMSFVKEENPSPLSACSEVEEDKSWHEAVKSLQTSQETKILKSREVMVNTQCLLELFQFCWLCHKDCRIAIKGSKRLFSVTQDCQSCGYHRDWRSHPPSAEPPQTSHRDEEHVLEDGDADEILSSDDECSNPVFIKMDGSYLSNDDKEANLQEEEVTKKRRRKRESSDSSDE